MDLTIADDIDDDTPGDEALTRLRHLGLLPRTTTVRPIERRAINPAPTGPVFAHLDPRQTYLSGRAALEVIRPGWFNNQVTPPFIRVGNNGDGLYPLLGMLFSGLGSSSDMVVSVDVRLHGSNDVVQFSATGNPLTMTVSHAAMGGQRGTVLVPVKANAAGTAVVYMILPHAVGGDGGIFDWFGADLRQL